MNYLKGQARHNHSPSKKCCNQIDLIPVPYTKWHKRTKNCCFVQNALLLSAGLQKSVLTVLNCAMNRCACSFDLDALLSRLPHLLQGLDALLAQGHATEQHVVGRLALPVRNTSSQEQGVSKPQLCRSQSSSHLLGLCNAICGHWLGVGCQANIPDVLNSRFIQLRAWPAGPAVNAQGDIKQAAVHMTQQKLPSNPQRNDSPFCVCCTWHL